MAALGGLYALFGPTHKTTTISTNAAGETIRFTDTHSLYSEGLHPLAWLLFAVFAAAIVVIAASGLQIATSGRSKTRLIALAVATAVLLTASAATAITVGFLLLPGALIALLATYLAFRRPAAE